MTFKVRASQCSTCIYRRDSALDIEELEKQIRDPRLPGHFRGFRVCHTPKRNSGLCCRGFWNRHKDRFDAGQIAQRLGLVAFTDDRKEETA